MIYNVHLDLTFSSAEWRLPLGESGLLEFFLEVISTEGVPHEIVLPALRLVGNACADTSRDLACLDIN